MLLSEFCTDFVRRTMTSQWDLDSGPMEILGETFVAKELKLEELETKTNIHNWNMERRRVCFFILLSLTSKGHTCHKQSK